MNIKSSKLVNEYFEEKLREESLRIVPNSLTNNKIKSNKIKFYLPNFYRNIIKYTELDKWIKQNPEWFYNNIEIGAVYGVFPFSLWNGGRGNRGAVPVPAKEIESVIYAYNKQNIPVRFTFTNCLIEEKHLYDTYCNLIMDIANTGMNEVLVNSEILEKYLREKYPNYKYILSTTACIRDVNIINQKTKEYDMVVIDYNDNKNATFMDKIIDKQKIEILINEICPPNCPIRKAHYELLSRCNLDINYIELNIPECGNYRRQLNKDDLNFYKILEENSKNNLFVEELYQQYVPIGFNNFKIEGRGITPNYSLEAIYYYMVRPEYKDSIRYDLTSIQEKI